MNQMIDLCPYLPAESSHIRPPQTKAPGLSTLTLALDAIVTAVIGVSMLVGIGAFLLML